MERFLIIVRPERDYFVIASASQRSNPLPIGWRLLRPDKKRRDSQ